MTHADDVDYVGKTKKKEEKKKAANLLYVLHRSTKVNLMLVLFHLM